MNVQHSYVMLENQRFFLLISKLFVGTFSTVQCLLNISINMCRTDNVLTSSVLGKCPRFVD